MFKKGEYVVIRWKMGSMQGREYPEGTICKVVNDKELRVAKNNDIIPVNVNIGTVKPPTKLEKALL